MIKEYVKQIYELDMGFASREEIMSEYIDNFKKSFVGTYDELQAKMKEVREDAKQEFYRKKDENDKLIRQKEAEMLDYIFDNSSVKKLPNGRKVFDKLWGNAWRDEHAYGYEAVYNDFEDKEANFLEMYELTQGK